VLHMWVNTKKGLFLFYPTFIIQIPQYTHKHLIS